MRTLTLVVLVVFAAIVATNAFPSNDEARREATEENIVNYLRQMKAEKRQPGGGRGFGGRKNENDNDDDDDDNDNDNDDDDNNGNRLGWRKGDDDNDNDDDDDDNSGNRLGWRKGDDDDDNDDDDDDNSGIGWDDKKGSGWGKWDSEKDDDDKNDDDDGKLGTTANPWWFSEVGSSANPFPWWWFQTESPGNPWWSSETGSSENPWQMGSSPEPNLDMSGWDDMWDGIFAGQNSEGTDEEPEPEAATESPIANVLKVLGNIQQALGKKEKK